MAQAKETATASEDKQGVSAPTITLPKGGGAIHGMGEKFTSNPVTGTGSMSIPIAVSPGRSGFGPQLSLSYDSGTGNGAFGLGWNLSLPSITRKTDKGIPKYQPLKESDIFILSGAEDLVPELKTNEVIFTETSRTVGGVIYQVRNYRPRIEGLFARIERWTNQTNHSDIFWRSISKDNITTWYGKTIESRIADPEDASRIFSWLISQSHDDKGNVIVYEYKGENPDFETTFLAQANERNRTDLTRSANRYLKRIRYGNHTPYLPNLTEIDPWPYPSSAGEDKGYEDWFFEVVFDYGDHDKNKPIPYEPNNKWFVRKDPFSSYRAGFEVRTYRLCQRVLMFHHFPGETDVEANCLVRSTDFNYSYENDPKNVKNPIYSFLESASHTSYKRKVGGGYLSKSLPPLEFTYTQAIINETIREIDSGSLENLPNGIDGSSFQWVDLDGEGLSGILTEQGSGWFYKRNHSANNVDRETERTIARFSPVELVATKPNTMLSGGKAQFMDLAGDGQTDLVEMEGSVRGFYERTVDEDWEAFQPFTSWPNIDTRDPNLKFIDLTGDGHADILISEDQAFIWHASLAEAGYGAAQRAQQQFDEEKGPRLVFADSEQSIFLADLSGDGLTDLVRIRNGEVCYWPNLGYCRFGAKITMDQSPWFDACDQFNPRRLRLADIDGSGTTDLLYLHGKGVQIYFNQSGNSWSQVTELPAFPSIDNFSAIQVMDLLGTGTACLVWSSPLPNFARNPLRYIDLMAEGKPHLLIKMKNNLGAETSIHYAPSTKFYLEDKDAGKPWITKLPFPVHVVDKVTVTDKWRKTGFSSSYSYHHGYFDGIEREFRGFGRVEQIDVESYGEFKQGNVDSPYITDDYTLYQPPVKTVTWYHTGAFLDRERIITHFQDEYFPHSLKDLYPGQVKFLNKFTEIDLPQPDLTTQDLTAEEWREALRACKGMMLRQEIYELDIDALEPAIEPGKPTINPKQLPVKLYSTAYHNCHIQRLQPRHDNRYAVFLVAESEAITYHYELDIRKSEITQLSPDPRIAHTLNLTYDEYANIQQSVAVVYPRLGKLEDNVDLAKGLEDSISLINKVQQEQHISYSETHYTDDFGIENTSDDYRLRVPCEVLTYELNIPDQGILKLNELRKFKLSTFYPPSVPAPEIIAVDELLYHQLIDHTKVQKRIVEHARTLFFQEGLINPLKFGEHGRLGLTYEAYKLALTDELLDAAYIDSSGKNKLDEIIDDQGKTARDKLLTPSESGYLTDKLLAERFANTTERYKNTVTTGEYWIRSGIAGFDSNAAKKHFYLPKHYIDPFDNITTLEYDIRDLFVKSSMDMLQNKSAVTRFDYRVLAPREMQDINNNLSEVYFDVLGLPTAMAVKGKGTEGDNLDNFTDALAKSELSELIAFFVGNPYDEAQARTWLANATARHVYYFGEIINPDDTIVWGEHPACACGIVREQHVAQLNGNALSPIQTAFEYSDGMGSVVVKKVQAEPDKPGLALRWIANGKTILNNKGKPVKQYEPYFSSVGHHYEEPKEEGVTPVIYYDAAGRTIRTEMPDGSYSKVEFSPWHVQSFDPNDTAFDNDPDKQSNWYKRRMDPTHPRFVDFNTPENIKAAKAVEMHANTPSLSLLDNLGRDVISVAHNKFIDITSGALKEEKYLTFTKLDAEGKPLWIRDARDNLVMQYITPIKPTQASKEPNPSDPENMPKNSVPCYDIAGNLLFQHSMDAGDRWTINDAAGKPMLSWDFNQRQDETETVFDEHRVYFTHYDDLHRPVAHWLAINGGAAQMIERFEYFDNNNNPDKNFTNNLNGQLHKHYDSSGLKQLERLDFKGNPLEIRRQLAQAYKAPVIDWQTGSPTFALETETFVQITEYDALNRMTRMYNWHKLQDNSRVAVYEPQYSPRGLLISETLILKATKTVTGHTETNAKRTVVMQGIEYNVKGQKERIQNGNGTVSRYKYDEETFRLQQLRTTYAGADNTLPTQPSGLKDNKVLQNLYYSYDPVGNITEIRDDAYEPVFFQNQKVEPVSRYIYDALYRLVEASGRENGASSGLPKQIADANNQVTFSVTDPGALRNYTQQYVYDAVGNFKTMVHQAGPNGGWTRQYVYADDSNRLTKTLQGVKVLDSTDYRYDPHGNMLNVANVSPGQSMRWNSNDMIHFLDLQGGGLVYYNYDAGKQRTRKRLERQGDPIEERIDLGGYELYRKFTKQGDLKAEIESIHVFEGQHRILLVDDVLQTDNAKLKTGLLYRYQYSNHLGSATQELDDQAQIISYEEYHPYGTTAFYATRSQADTPKRYRYTGKERDEESGFSYHGARYLAGWLGRWVSCDPEGMIDGLNFFYYSQNNPVCLVDSDGKQSKPSVIIALPSTITFVDKKKKSIQVPGKLIVQSDKGTRETVLEPKSTSIPFKHEDNYQLPENKYIPDLGGYLEREFSSGELKFYSGPTPEALAVQAEIRRVEENSFQRSQELIGAAEMYKYNQLMFVMSEFAGTALGEFVIAPVLGRAFGAFSAEGTEIASGSGNPQRGKLASADFEGIRITGQETVNATPDEEEMFLFSVGVREEGSISEFFDGSTPKKWWGKPKSVRVETGPGVSSTTHTHPVSKVAVFSLVDADLYFGGGFRSETKHSVLGLRWPSASRVLIEEGLDPELTVVKTTVKQSEVTNGAWTKVQFDYQ